MVKNFEEYTYDVTDEERVIIPILIKGLSTKTKENPIHSDDICKKLNEYFLKSNMNITISGARLRKLTNLLRSKGVLPIIATSKGYYCSFDKLEIRNQIESLEDRARAIYNSAEGLRKFL
ncbi:MAG: hypothetical protein ACOVNU_09870 [Candidatus Kapaibacteriota bacterium]